MGKKVTNAKPRRNKPKQGRKIPGGLIPLGRGNVRSRRADWKALRLYGIPSAAKVVAGLRIKRAWRDATCNPAYKLARLKLIRECESDES